MRVFSTQVCTYECIIYVSSYIYKWVCTFRGMCTYECIIYVSSYIYKWVCTFKGICVYISV